MFRQLFSALTGGDELDLAFSDFAEMLDHAAWMFVQANEVLTRRSSAEEVQEALYSRDQAINDLLKSVRRKIVRHLAVNPGTDAAPSLALMSVAKDAERIGDYCKNVFEVGRFYNEDFTVAEYHEQLEAIYGDVETLFANVRHAWRESSSSKAKSAIKQADAIRGRCDDVIEQLLRGRESMKMHEAVAYSLLARHYKRVAAHLANISTAVMGRIEDLDFRKP